MAENVIGGRLELSFTKCFLAKHHFMLSPLSGPMARSWITRMLWNFLKMYKLANMLKKSFVPS